MTDAALKRAGWATQRRTPALKAFRPKITCVTASQPTPAESTMAGSAIIASNLTGDSPADLLRAIVPTLYSSRVMALEITEASRATQGHRMEADTRRATIIRTQTQLGKKRTRLDQAEAVAADQVDQADQVEAVAADQVDQAEVAEAVAANQEAQAEVPANQEAQVEPGDQAEAEAEETSRQPSEPTSSAERPATTPTAATTTSSLTTPSGATNAFCTNPFTTTLW